MRLLIIIVLISCVTATSGQTLGGNSVFNFLKFSNTPQLSGLGGVNVSQPGNDIGLAFNNPALLKQSMHSQINAVFNNFYDNIKIYQFALGYHHPNLNTSFLYGIEFFDYGGTLQTDASGNILGRFHPTDWVMQLSASRSYNEKWNYGATLKFISSNYGPYRSNGLAIDVGVLYTDSLNGFTASLLAKNMGTQLKKYPGTTADDLPFDLQAGLTKRLAKAPFSFSLTAQRLHHFNIHYKDSLFNNENGFGDNSSFFNKLFDHLVVGTTVYVGDKIEVYGGYNFLRRKELNIGNAGNGLNGFSIGVGALFGKLAIRYARAYYQSNTAYDQLGLNLQLNKYFGLKRFGEKVHW